MSWIRYGYEDNKLASITEIATTNRIYHFTGEETDNLVPLIKITILNNDKVKVWMSTKNGHPNEIMLPVSITKSYWKDCGFLSAMGKAFSGADTAVLRTIYPDGTERTWYIKPMRRSPESFGTVWVDHRYDDLDYRKFMNDRLNKDRIEMQYLDSRIDGIAYALENYIQQDFYQDLMHQIKSIEYDPSVMQSAIDSISEVAASVENSTNQTKDSFDRMYALFKKNSFSELSFMQRLKLLFLGHT